MAYNGSSYGIRNDRQRAHAHQLYSGLSGNLRRKLTVRRAGAGDPCPAAARPAKARAIFDGAQRQEQRVQVDRYRL
jgi:hypothetical protein